MSSKKDDDKNPRDTDDDHPPVQRQNETQTTDNPPMEGNPPTGNTQIPEIMSLPHLESLNLFNPLQSNPIRPTGLLTSGPPRTTSFASENVQSWLQGVIVPEDTTTSTSDISNLARRLSSDSLNDQRYIPLRVPFATRPFSEGILSNLLIPDVPNIPPLIMASLRNPMSSRPRLPRTPNTGGRPEQDELRFRQHPTTVSRNRSELMTGTYSVIFPNLSRMTTPCQTSVLRTSCTCTSRSLTPGRFISPIGLSRSNSPISTPRIISSTPYQPRFFAIIRPSSGRSRASSTVVHPIPRLMGPSRNTSAQRVVLHPRRRLGFSTPADVIEPVSVTPTTHSITRPTTEEDSSRPLSRDALLSLDTVPTRIAATTLQPIVTNPGLPLESPEVPLTDNDNTETPILLPERDLTLNTATTIYERKKSTEASTVYQPIVLNQRIPMTQPASSLYPRFTVARRPVEPPLIRETRRAVEEVTRVITFTNPETKEVQEYWVRRNQEMLSQVAGSVNDTAASARPSKRGPVKTVVVKKIIRVEQPPKKKNLKGIKRKPANPVKSTSSSSSSSEESPSQSARTMNSQQRYGLPAYDPSKYSPLKGSKYQQVEASHIRTKRPRKCSHSASSGYPVWRDDSNTCSSSESEIFPFDESENPTPDCPPMTLEEKIESYFEHIRRHESQQNDDDAH